MVFSAEVADDEDVRGLCEQIGMHFEKFGDARLLSVSVVKDGESLKVGRGPYKNVMLTDAGYADFSYKLYQKGYRFKDHFAVILEWSEGNAPSGDSRGEAQSFDVNEFFRANLERGLGK